MSGNIQVVVVGGGYAGVMAADRLTQRADVQVTVVNPRPRFVPRLRLHQLVGGTHDAVVDYTDVLADGVELVVDTVTRIDAQTSTVELAGGGTLGYDYLVYAVGSLAATPPVPGVAEFAYPLATFEAAQRLRSALLDTPQSAAVTVVGGGPTGIETAAELAEQGRAVTLVCGGTLAPYLHAKARRTARRYLTRLGVEVLEGPEATVTAVTRDTVELGGGHAVRSAITIWAAGFGVPDLAARSGLRTDAAGRLLTYETLTSVDDERIVAAGDSSAPSGLPFRMSAYAAGCLGAHAADTLLSRMAGRQPAPIDLSFSAMCISFGRTAGIFQLAHKDDTAMPIYFPGPVGKKLKEVSCEFSVKHLVTEARKPGSHKWMKDGKHRPAQLAARQQDAATPVA
ncbi:FAD-dependent oxidoreductase [Nocardia farcinica]|uniref:NAD(P)/FAD-dependent oxidoreductase n=1 Tax=Nocardia TaxID=1817 RepID=UPI000BEFBBA4|nr:MULTISPECIES: FAD-dependent oxidoreductase [Nocardia]MBF6184153.1 FAD-dependent oxidoreductase [Nocardia farcinica]MBF6258124.1 FAD-dependent oxidoreductase [Nocardia farcinica]MBF6290739.1 FAD-dependent oxidoreductase [Nocardia farcinica]MBF6309996.1 FAD-dependent oxidoreductase [Nocardia farcinica]MBF6377912.1 FAD-dependent oxidoreductase [Nocardia farcinica]